MEMDSFWLFHVVRESNEKTWNKVFLQIATNHGQFIWDIK